MPFLPPLECLRFFETAARRESFARAAEELSVSPAAVAYRIKVLERHLGHPLFHRYPRGVRLSRRGKRYLSDVQRILGELARATELQRGSPGKRTVRLVSVESLAEKWLIPRMGELEALQPGIALEVETNHRGVDPDRRDFDMWLAYAGPTDAPRPHPRPEDDLIVDTLFEETLQPVCSPTLLRSLGKPRTPADLNDWPLLYDLGWDSDWPHWFARQGIPAPDLSRASGFRLYSMVIQATVDGLGATIGHLALIAEEIANGALVPLFDDRADVPARYRLITNRDAGERPEVRALREWILNVAADRRATAPGRKAVA